MHKSEDAAFAAFVGIDWADKKHDICLWVPGQEKRERLVLEHRPEAIHAWAQQLRERFGGASVGARWAWCDRATAGGQWTRPATGWRPD